MEKLDVEYFQKLAYNRSKIWSDLLGSYESEAITQLENLEDDMDIREIDDFLSSAEDNDVNDDLSHMEDDHCKETVNTEFLKNASNTSQFSLLITNTPADLSAITKNEEERQYVDVINKTLPILYEHERQLQEFGFDKVLTSFKRDEIEDKFGSWLNRHNSLFGGDNTLINNNRNFEIEKAVPVGSKFKKGKSCSIENQEMDMDSDASLQSGETARYIRSSKVSSAKNYTTTMIKTYRKIKTTREALREKYACETDEDDYHRNALRVRKKLGSMECLNYYDKTPIGRLYKNERLAHTTRSHRRKVLRKRINSNDYNANYSSSDSEYSENYHCKNLKFCCSKRNHCASNFCNTPLTPRNKIKKILNTRSSAKMTSALRNRVYFLSRSMSSSSSLSSPLNNIAEKRRAKKRNIKFSNDERTCKRESECCCFNDKVLCKQYKHVADTSTEEWYVDNGCTPKHQMIMPGNKAQAKKSQQSKSGCTPKQQMNTPGNKAQAKKSQQSKSGCTPKQQMNTPGNKAQVKKSQQSKSGHCEKLHAVAEKEQSDDKVKTKSNLNENEREEDVLSCESSDACLKMAIKLSVESYRKEQEASSAQKDTAKKSTKSNKKLSTIKENISKQKTAIKNKPLSEKTNTVAKKANVTLDLTSPSKKSNEDTFFAQIQTQAICNSTALSAKGHAYKRQLADKPAALDKLEDDTVTAENSSKTDVMKSRKKQKTISKTLESNGLQNESGNISAAVTSTTVRSPELQSTLNLTQAKESKQMEQSNEKTCMNQIDCAHVTSTTSVEVSKSKKTNNETEKVPQKNQLLNSDDNFIPNSFLVYAPNNQNLTSAADSYFTITQEHLSTFLGERGAQKFLKYYAGRRRFRTDSMVYYKPPRDRSVYQNSSTSSESTDEMDHIGEYGVLFAITK